MLDNGVSYRTRVDCIKKEKRAVFSHVHALDDNPPKPKPWNLVGDGTSSMWERKERNNTA